MIKRQKIDLSEERRILSYMITSTPYLNQIQDVAIPKLFQSTFCQTVAQWIWEYFDHTQEAPGKAIEDIYIKKSRGVPEDDNELIQEFLSKLSKDWEKAKIKNVNYIVKNTTEYFKLRSLDRLHNQIDEAVQNNDAPTGERLISEYRNVERRRGRGVDLLRDAAPIIRAFSREQEYLFSYPGALGKAIGPFMRGDFFAILGAMKKGKTHYLWYTGYRAMLMGLKVLFVSLEMTEPQMLRRMWQTMVGKPLETGAVRIPYFHEIDAEYKYQIRFKTKKLTALSTDDIEKKQNFYRRSVRSGCAKLITFASDGATVKDIETELVNYEYYEGFIPDVVVIDYADLLKPENTRADYRHQLDNIWKSLRGIAQKRSVLLVTASQSGRGGLTRDIGAADVAEDVRKLAHVTKMVHLNQNKLEKDDDVMRFETTVQREGKQYSGEVVVLQCLDIGRGYMKSQERKEVDMRKYEEKKKGKNK